MRDYHAVGGRPDVYLLMSWFPHPALTIPDADSGPRYPAFRTLLALARQLHTLEATTAPASDK